MVIGIHAIAAFKKEKTGVEEYAYQLVKNIAMLPEAKEHRFILYTNQINPKSEIRNPKQYQNSNSEIQNKFQVSSFKFQDVNLPANFKIRVLQWPIIWTQIRLSLEMLKKECDVLFIPAHVLPIIHPKNSVVTIHGLEYEFFPQYYSPWLRRYLRWATKYSTRQAKKIIAVSNNTKKDLIELYEVNKEKIEVVHHGVEISKPKALISNKFQNLNDKKYILYIGRIELKKNIEGIIKAFEVFKEKYKLPYKLALAGPSGFGYKKIRFQVSSFKFQKSIILAGYIKNKEKEWLYRHASLFLLPSHYEGFGMPILEAQARGLPVITSNISSMPEVGGNGALYVDPNNYNDIADKVYQLLTNNALRQDIINNGYENVKKFSWEKCARETLNVLLS